MKRIQAFRAVSVAALALVFAACSDAATAPTVRSLDIDAAQAITGGPDLSDYKSFAGQLWTCPDTPTPDAGFFYAWRIIDNATNTIVSSGTVKNAIGGTCILLGSVPANRPGRYTAFVKEDPGLAYQVTSISADYGTDFPITAPTPTVNIPKRWIQSLITHDFGVQFTFFH